MTSIPIPQRTPATIQKSLEVGSGGNGGFLNSLTGFAQAGASIYENLLNADANRQIALIQAQRQPTEVLQIPQAQPASFRIPGGNTTLLIGAGVAVLAGILLIARG